MINLNRVVLVGRLTSDIELRKTKNSVSVCTFTVAISRKWKRDAEQEADFINCIAWKQAAEFLANYAKKGTIVCVNGSIQTRDYTNTDGKKVYVTEVVSDDVQIISDKPISTHKEPENNATDTHNNVSISPDELPFY